MIELSKGVKIADEKLFVESHEEVIKNNRSKRLVDLAKERLELYYKIKGYDNKTIKTENL